MLKVSYCEHLASVVFKMNVIPSRTLVATKRSTCTTEKQIFVELKTVDLSVCLYTWFHKFLKVISHNDFSLMFIYKKMTTYIS